MQLTAPYGIRIMLVFVIKYPPLSIELQGLGGLNEGTNVALKIKFGGLESLYNFVKHG